MVVGTPAEVQCAHTHDAECWLCSDARPWWADAREAAGLGVEPPNAGLRAMMIRDRREAQARRDARSDNISRHNCWHR